MSAPLKHIQPTRYYSETVEMGFWEALRRYLKYRRWSWKRIKFNPVYKGQPGYEAAPFEENIIQLK